MVKRFSQPFISLSFLWVLPPMTIFNRILNVVKLYQTNVEITEINLKWHFTPTNGSLDGRTFRRNCLPRIINDVSTMGLNVESEVSLRISTSDIISFSVWNSLIFKIRTLLNTSIITTWCIYHRTSIIFRNPLNNKKFTIREIQSISRLCKYLGEEQGFPSFSL